MKHLTINGLVLTHDELLQTVKRKLISEGCMADQAQELATAVVDEMFRLYGEDA